MKGGAQAGAAGPAIRRRPGGDPEVIRTGVPRDGWRDVYHFVLVQRWGVFYALLIGTYGLINCGFATLYWLRPGCIGEGHPGRWLEDFFFSFETLATVGYGVMHPQTLYAHWVVVCEIVVGVLLVPLATGLTIVKFARPSARVIFSDVAVVTAMDGVRTLMFRLANLRANQIFEAKINLSILRRYTTHEGLSMRQLVDVTPVRDTNPMFMLSWSVMHRIDETSPLWGVAAETLGPDEMVLLAVMTGLDATSSATVHARHVYDLRAVRDGWMFDDIIEPLEDGRLRIDYRQLSAVHRQAA